MKEKDKNKEEKLTPEEELQAENRIKALNHELEFGSKTFISDDAPPEIIAEFLDNVNAYDRAHSNAAMVKLYDYIGQPDVPAVAEIPDDGFEQEISKIMATLAEHGVHIDRPTHLSAKGYYEFLITDLFEEEVMDIRLPGMDMNFIYSEFRKDGPEFIKENGEEFVLEILNLKRNFYSDFLSENCRDQHAEISKEEAIKRIEDFRSGYAKIKINGMSADRTQLTEKGMFFFFGLVWEGFPVGGGDRELHKGLGVCQMELSNHTWWVKGVIIPGFNM